VFGHVSLGGAREVDDFAHVSWRVADGLKDAQPGGFTENFEDGGDALELLGGKDGVIRWLTHE